MSMKSLHSEGFSPLRGAWTLDRQTRNELSANVIRRAVETEQMPNRNSKRTHFLQHVLIAGTRSLGFGSYSRIEESSLYQCLLSN